jgi:hypothetical protein
LKAVIKTAWHTPVPNVEQRTPDDGQRRCPKHVEIYDRINLGNYCVWFVIKRKAVPMHGDMNIFKKKLVF